MTKLTKEEYYANAVKIYDFFLSVRMSPAQACGILANCDAECSLNPSEVGDKGKAVGLFQIHPDRRDVIASGNKQFPGCGIMITKDTKLDLMLEATWFELRHTEKHALIELLDTTTAYDAGYAFCKYYERSGLASQPHKRGLNAETWLKYFSDNSNTVTANNTSNNATANTTTVIEAGVYADTTTDIKDFEKNSKVAKANNANKFTNNTANNDTADNINDNISNVNFFDPEVARAPDETTYFDTYKTSNTLWVQRGDMFNEGAFENDEAKKLWDEKYVPKPNTVFTATSEVSVNTLKNYANSDPANTIPLNSNRTRGMNDPREDDFTTDMSNKSDETFHADEVANGRREPPEEKEEEKKENVVKPTKETAAKRVKNPNDEKEAEKTTLSEKANEENKHDNTSVFREYYSNTEVKDSANTVHVDDTKNVSA